MRKKRVSLSDIARITGVSKMTVSMALKDHPSISRETTIKIKEIAHNLGFVPNRLAKGLNDGRSYTIAIVVGGILDDYQEQFIRGIVKVAMKAGYTTAVALMNDEEAGEDFIIEKFNQMMVDGFISFHLNHVEPYERLLADHVPFVLYARNFPDMESDYVGADNHRGGYLMTEHFIHLGHTRLAYIYPTSMTNSSDILERQQGCLQALLDHHLPAPLVIPFELDFTYPIDLTRNQALLHALRDDSRPTALFVANDMTAANVYMVVKALHLRIPEDISIGGFEGLLAGKLITPPLTTVITPVMQMGEAACTMLISKIEHQIEYTNFQSVRLSPSLDVRCSTAPPPVLRKSHADHAPRSAQGVTAQ